MVAKKNLKKTENKPRGHCNDFRKYVKITRKVLIRNTKNT